MKTIFVLLVCMFYSLSVRSQPVKVINPEMRKILNRQDKIDSMINVLNVKQQNIISEQETTNNIVSKSFDGVSMQLSGASESVGVIGTAIGVLAVILGVYVTYVQIQTSKIYTKNRLALEETEKIKREVEDLNNIIQSNVPKLYEKIKREEINKVMKRLETQPEDIVNHSSLLYTSDLISSDFHSLVRGYLGIEFTSLPSEGKFELKTQFHALFAQHFTYETMMTANVKDEFLSNLYAVFMRLWRADYKATIIGFCKYIQQEKIENVKLDIEYYFFGIEAHGPLELIQLLSTILTVLNHEERLELLEVFIEKEDRLRRVLAGYQQCLATTHK